ncbi:MAG: hypothetical protein IKU03_09010 [Bacteroidales bacterium]|nr:hypothetical protein [Bacteroidales bacterium]
MKRILLSILCCVLLSSCFAQAKPMRFMGIGMNSTLSTFVSKLKGKGFTEDVNHNKPNLVVMKGVFAGERVKLEVRSAAKTHLVYSVNVFFNVSTQFTYEELQKRLTDKYGEAVLEVNDIKNEPVFVKYTTDYTQWQLDTDTVTNAYNAIVLSKCSYHSTSPVTITYLDGKNSKVEALEVNSDF